MITVNGPHGIKATILADSISEAGIRFRSFELEYPRIILAEANTHRMLSKNSFSSRAVSFDKMVNQLGGRPVRFGGANKGMQDSGEHDTLINDCHTAEEWWNLAKLSAKNFAQGFYEAGYAKQVFNRVLEPYQMMKTVLSGTEFDNFYWLRKHGAADPTFEALAQTMYAAEEQSTPELLKAGEWHLPYLNWTIDDVTGGQNFYLRNEDLSITEISLEDAIKVSCARCAAVSYRNENYGLEKSKELYERLVGSDRKHSSALEHCATPMEQYDGLVNCCGEPDTWEKGVSHMDKNCDLWSGNFKGWRQYRKMIPGENYTNNESTK